ENEKLWPGQFVSIRVVVDTLVDAKVVATPAVRRGPNGTFLYVVGDDNRAKVQPVEVVTQDETHAVIGNGADAGERIVTVGFAQLADGKAVQTAGGDASQPANPQATGGGKGRHRPEGSDNSEKRQRRQRGETGALNAPPEQGEVSGTREVAR